jgi:hypothetical protein
MKIIHIFLMLCLTYTINHHGMDPTSSFTKVSNFAPVVAESFDGHGKATQPSPTAMAGRLMDRSEDRSLYSGHPELVEERRTGTEQSSLWYFLPKEIITKIVAYSDLATKTTLHQINQQLFRISCKNNIPNMLHHIPCILSRQDHLDCMVMYAKEDNITMVQQLIKIAAYCNHADWFDVIPYFLSKDSSDLFLLQKHSAYFNENLIEIFLPHIMTVYKGDTHTINQYKINYGKVISYGYYDDTAIHIQHISHVNVAIINNHPISVVQLMLAQNQNLLNTKDNCWAQTPLMMAINSNNIPMCKFLLSYKNIDLNKSTYLGADLVAYAQTLNRDQIVTLLIDYDNTHP